MFLPNVLSKEVVFTQSVESCVFPIYLQNRELRENFLNFNIISIRIVSKVCIARNTERNENIEAPAGDIELHKEYTQSQLGIYGAIKIRSIRIQCTLSTFDYVFKDTL